mmetsp:Transcript_43460/g.117930  ORF Transcript_43460/g.117930 Transcript_43460/m.117930 type:complete len:1300 (-) Transcript_43460:42-3941(-)
MPPPANLMHFRTGRGTVAKHRKSMVPPDYEGWLITRKENQALGWKKRYVRLRGPTFTVYRDECIAAAKAQFDLTDWRFYPSRGKGNKFSTRKEIFRFTLEAPTGEVYDWAADIEELRTKWLEMLGYASENAKLAQVDSTKMLTQHGETPAAVQVSCSFFQEHGTFGFSKCGVCGFSKRQHFSPAEVGPATSGLAYSGYVLIKKRKDKATTKNWKKRFMELKDNSLTWKAEKQQADSDHRVVITMECELLRLNKADKADDDDGVGSLIASGSRLGKRDGPDGLFSPSSRMISLDMSKQAAPPSFRGNGFIFTIKSDSGETNTFQVQTSEERERWLEALLGARMFVYDAHTTRVNHAQAALTNPDTPAAQIEQETLYLKALQEMTPPRPIVADAAEHNEADKLSKLARQLKEDDAKLNGFLQDTGRKNGVMKLARTLQRLNNAAMLTSRDMGTCVSILACFQAIIRSENGRNSFLRQFEVVEEVCNLATGQTEPNRNAHQLQPQAAIMASSMILSPLVLISTLGCEIITDYIRSMATPGFEDYEGAPEPKPFESIIGIMNDLFEHSHYDVLAALTGLINAITQAPRTPEERARYRAELRRVGFEQYLLTVLELVEDNEEPMRGSLLGSDLEKKREARAMLVSQATAYQVANRRDLDDLDDNFQSNDFECVLHKLWQLICETDEPSLRNDATSEMMAILRGVEDGEVQQSSKKWAKGPAMVEVEQAEFDRMENEIVTLRQELEDAKVPTLDAEAVERAAKLEEENKKLRERIAELEAGGAAGGNPQGGGDGGAGGGGGGAEAKPVNPLAAMLAARAGGGAAAEAKPAEVEAKPVNPLAAMLAARAGGPPAKAAAAEAKPVNPLAAMLAARSGGGGGVMGLPGRPKPAIGGGGGADVSPTLKYEKMLKMHIPKEAVKMKMQAEGVDPSLLFKEDAVGGDGTPAPPPGVDMTKYIKMLKMHIPRSAVILKMQSEGIDPVYLPGGSGGDAAPRAAVVKYTGPRPKGKVRALFWEKVGAAGSWWSTYKGGFAIVSRHMDELEEAFGSGTAGAAAAKPGTGGGGGGSSLGAAKGSSMKKKDVAPKVLDGARCQNTAITIKKIKLKAEDVSEALLKCDVNTLGKEKLELINLIMPNKEEEDGLREYVDSGKKVVDLNEVEQYIYELLKLARVHDKLLLCTLRASGHIKLHELESSLKQTQAGCRALMECTALKDILDVVVQVGNVLNCTAPSRLVEAGKAGVRLKTLEKLAVTKAVRGEHPDLLHFVVTLIMEHKEQSVEINHQQLKGTVKIDSAISTGESARSQRCL